MSETLSERMRNLHDRLKELGISQDAKTVEDAAWAIEALETDVAMLRRAEPAAHDGDVGALTDAILDAVAAQLQEPYPESVFPEVPESDWPIIRACLRDGCGVLLDRVSASNMRHVGKVVAQKPERLREAVFAALRTRTPQDDVEPDNFTCPPCRPQRGEDRRVRRLVGARRAPGTGGKPPGRPGRLSGPTAGP